MSKFFKDRRIVVAGGAGFPGDFVLDGLKRNYRIVGYSQIINLNTEGSLQW